MMKICAISDFHGNLEFKDMIEECDVLCICGDFVPILAQRNIAQCESWICKKFIPFLNSLPCKHVVLVGGNHDFVLDRNCYLYNDSNAIIYESVMSAFNSCEKLHYLNKTSVTIDGVKFYGDPTTTGPVDWAFYVPDSEDPFSDLDMSAEVVLTHQPPVGAVGTVLQYGAYNYMANYGSNSLFNAILRMDGTPKKLFCGHIHSGQHYPEEINNVVCRNVSLYNEDYKFAFDPTYIAL